MINVQSTHRLILAQSPTPPIPLRLGDVAIIPSTARSASVAHAIDGQLAAPKMLIMYTVSQKTCLQTFIHIFAKY